MKNDNVNHPSHYTDGKIEVIDFIEDKKLDFHLGNAVKYIARAGKKDPAKLAEDLEKARWYLNRKIEKLKPELAQAYKISGEENHALDAIRYATANILNYDKCDHLLSCQFPKCSCNSKAEQQSKEEFALGLLNWYFYGTTITTRTILENYQNYLVGKGNK